MPIASGLGFVERENHHTSHVRTVVRVAAVRGDGGEEVSDAYVASSAERAACGLMIASVVAGALATLGWFALTFDGT